MPAPKDPVKREEWLRKLKVSTQKHFLNPKYRLKHKVSVQKRSQNPEWRYNNKKAMQKRAQDPNWLRNQKERTQKLSQNPEWRYNNKKAAQDKNKDFYKDPEWIRKNKEVNRKNAQTPEWQHNHTEGLIGGFWYGNVRYPNPPRYCEFWCPNLWHRIDEAQNYQSILSGKTKFDNGGRALSRHHVYWQPKACCEWDEDAQGYYAWIDIGTARKSNRIKYYIRDDPNKFVLLTMSEHKMISKNKLKWIEIFEELIKTKLGGVCYLPKG